MKIPRVLQILLFSEKGERIEIQTPYPIIQKTLAIFTLTFFVALLSITGWLSSRYQAVKFEKNYLKERLKVASLESQLNDFLQNPKEASLAAKVSSQKDIAENFSLLPALESGDLGSSVVEFGAARAEYDSTHKELVVNFDLIRKPPREGSGRFFWLVLLHGSQGVLSFPPTFSNKTGNLIQYSRGQVIEDLKNKKNINAQFKVDSFFERAESEPASLTLFVYDQKGTLTLKKRLELAMTRSKNSEGGASL